MTTARYDGIAGWYDSLFAHYANDDQPGTHLAGLLGSGPGVCVDVGCGTGLGAVALARAGWEVVGVDVSADQLRLAAPRCAAVARSDAHALPLRDASVGHVAAMFLHTDVEDFARVVGETARILRPGGVFAYVGVRARRA